MKKIVLIALCILPFLTFAQDTLVKWTFPNNPDDSIADGGIPANTGMMISAQGGTSAMNFTTLGATNYCASATKWTTGTGTKYWQIKVVTLGYSNIQLSSKQYSSSTGPRDFKAQYMIGYGGIWNDFSGNAVAVATNWTSGKLVNVPLPSACNNQDTVYLRWIMTSDTAVNDTALVKPIGSSKIDDIYIIGVSSIDVTPPTVLEAFAISLSTVKVRFSEAVNTTAENIANYTGLSSISSAVRNATLDTVSLTLATPLQSGVPDTLTISNVQDTSSNAMTVPQSFMILYNSTIADIVFTEIMYNDPSATADSLEFIELYNNGSTPANISDYSFSYGVVYTFPVNTIINPGIYLVVAKDTNAVNNFFGIGGTLQWTSNSLSNSGEKIEIINSAGDVIDSLTYSTSSPWPTSPNNNGPSLTLCDPTLDNSVGSNWQASTEYVDSLNNKPVFATPGTGCIITNIENYSMNNYFVNCFPNPVSEVLTLTLDEQAKEIVVLDIIGNIVYKTSKLSSVTIINTEKLNNGIYFIKIIFNDNTIITRKISFI